MSESEKQYRFDYMSEYWGHRMADQMNKPLFNSQCIHKDLTKWDRFKWKYINPVARYFKTLGLAVIGRDLHQHGWDD